MGIDTQEPTIEITAYPQIIKKQGVCGGAAIIENTRLAVWPVIDYYYKVGLSVEEMLAEWDYIQPAQIFSALAYYHDNQAEIDQLRMQNAYPSPEASAHVISQAA